MALAATVTTPAEPYGQWINEAAVPTASEQVEVVEAPCPTADALACTERSDPMIWYDRQHIPFDRRFTFWHELGHRFDYQMPKWARRRFQAITKIQGPWPKESFADAYAVCARGRPGQAVNGISAEEQAAVCRLLWHSDMPDLQLGMHAHKTAGG